MSAPTRQDGDWIAAYSGAKALVLGGSGFIGGWVTRALDRAGAEVVVTARDTQAARRVLARRSTRAEILDIDLAAAGAAGVVLRATRPDIVFNLAVHGVDHGEREVTVMAALNTRLVSDVCEELGSGPEPAKWRGLRLVHVGSALEYGDVRGRVREDDLPQPTTDYGRSKLLATQRVRQAGVDGLRAVVARLFTVYGPGEQAGRLLPTLSEASRTAGRVPLSAGLQRRDFTYVEDAAEGLLRLGVSPARPGEVVNVATGRLTSVREFALTAAGILGIDAARLDFGALPGRDSEMCHDEVDVTRLRQLTAWAPDTDIAEGLRRAKEWEHAAR